MQDRRNFYRILQLQPDAPFELVRANYHALMTKLGAHPDLGGEHWSAAHLNAAYATLRDPRRREAYDQELLALYDIDTLSLGPFASELDRRGPREEQPAGESARNYYRVLGVQVDAHETIVQASYRALIKRGANDRADVERAYAVIGDPDRRRAYDRLLRSYGHREAIARLAEPEVSTRGSAPDYHSVIRRYCAFCKTPFADAVTSDDCQECGSPLFPPPEALLDLGRRVVRRFDRDDTVELTVHWPGPTVLGRLIDLSPTGMRCITDWPLDPGDRVRVASERFSSVGEVAHSQHGAGETVAGLRFLRTHFRDERGAFVSLKI